MRPLLDLLVTFDKFATSIDFFSSAGDAHDLFPLVFRLCFYNDKQYSVSNHPLEQIRVLEPDEIQEAIGKAELPIAKVNIVVNNLLTKQIMAMTKSSDEAKMKLMMSLGEILFTEEKMISTRRLGRIMVYMGLLFDLVRGPKQAQYMMGSLFGLGGLLKIEARNYLETKRKYDPDFRVVSPLIEDQKNQEDAMQRGRRDLKDEDLEYFDGEDGLVQVVTFLMNALLKGKERMLTAENFDYYLDWSHPDFISKLDEEMAKNPDKIGRLEATHNVLCFLFDFLQFGFQYLVIADKTPETV